MLLRITVAEVDMATVDAFKAQLAELEMSHDERATVDFADVTYIDSSGINALVTASENVRTTGRSFAVINASDHVRRVFTVTGLADLLDARPRTDG